MKREKIILKALLGYYLLIMRKMDKLVIKIQKKWATLPVIHHLTFLCTIFFIA
jgi:RsiW-degrading membrane proteinase PrsW (M82 family)